MLKTPQAAAELHISYFRLMSLLRGGRLTPPRKDSSGDYLWSKSDLSAARMALLTIDRRKRTVLPIPEVRGQADVPTRIA